MLPHVARRFACAFKWLVIGGKVGDQARRATNLDHHLVTGINTQRTSDALQLLSFANVDTHRAHSDTGVTIDAIAQRRIGQGLFQLCPRFATPIAVRYRHGVFVHHRGLNTWPRAHVSAYLFLHEPAENKRGRGKRNYKGIRHERRLSGEKLDQQGWCICKIEHPRTTG